MMKKYKALIVCVLVLFIGLWCLYYFYPRNVSFELIKEISKQPYPKFEESGTYSFNYVPNKERLKFYMIDTFKKEYCIKVGLKGYTSFFVENLALELNFEKYDYILTYQKQLKKLTYSPYLTRTKDGLYFDKRIPLIPTWKTEITDSMYIYRIKKNNNFRAPGP